MKKYQLLVASVGSVLLCLTSHLATAQDTDVQRIELDLDNGQEASHAQAVDKVKQVIFSRTANEILSISGTQKIDDQVIFVDTLRFDNDARMQLMAGDRDEIFIVARELRLSGPSFKGTIEFYDRKPQHGADGAPPQPALRKLSRGGSRGRDGINGQFGHPGGPGKTRKLPTIYLVTNEIVQSTGGLQDYADLRIHVDGIDGGNGGAGGNGQNGQTGQDGQHGRANDLRICTRGPGSGGNGGRGGSFGLGGTGGNGGDGATLVFIVPADSIDEVKDIRVRSRGGLTGTGGINGKPGAGGSRGSRGSRPGLCRGGSHGRKGAVGQSAPAQRADSGENEGKRGRIYYHVANILGS